MQKKVNQIEINCNVFGYIKFIYYFCNANLINCCTILLVIINVLLFHCEPVSFFTFFTGQIGIFNFINNINNIMNIKKYYDMENIQLIIKMGACANLGRATLK